MSTTIFIPPDNNPVTTGVSTNYTVPSGKYAEITVHLTATAITKPTYNVTTGSITAYTPRVVVCDNQALATVHKFIAKAGDVITGSTSAASATHNSSVTTSANNNLDTGFQTSTTTVTHNGNTIAQLVAKSFLYANIDISVSGSTALDYASTTGTSSFYIEYTEKYVIS